MDDTKKTAEPKETWFVMIEREIANLPGAAPFSTWEEDAKKDLVTAFEKEVKHISADAESMSEK